MAKKVKGMSLNPIPSIIRYYDLIDAWRLDNKIMRIDRLNQMSFKRWLYLTNIDFDEYINRPIDRLKYYQRFANYGNNFKVVQVKFYKFAA